MTDNEEFEEAMGIAEEFDRMTCQEQVRLVLDMLTDAAKEDDMDKVRAIGQIRVVPGVVGTGRNRHRERHVIPPSSSRRRHRESLNIEYQAARRRHRANTLHGQSIVALLLSRK
jgi:hypothetical protein